MTVDQLEFAWGEPQWGEDAHESLHALHEGQIIAFLDLRELPTGELGIDQITVEKDWRRQGVATRLWQLAQQQHPNLVLHSYDWTDEGEAWAERLPGRDLPEVGSPGF